VRKKKSPKSLAHRVEDNIKTNSEKLEFGDVDCIYVTCAGVYWHALLHMIMNH
jgi:hypothetical protein